MGATILKTDTELMLLKYYVTYHKLFVVVPAYNNVDEGQPNMYFWNKSMFTNITV